MNPERETLFQEYLANQGTVVKPYYWQTLSKSCAKCPYHIRTGEEARVPYMGFHKAFGFPYGLMSPQNKHLIFYELRSFSGTLVQKGHATNCIKYNIHPESMLFEMGGYLDAVTYDYDSIGYIILYSNYSPCNEAEHCCISKIYNFLTKYPDITLCIYFSQLYHTEDDFPVSIWNCEALRSLASLWPHVTLNPLCGGVWHSLLCNFVSGMPEATLYHPILPARALADQQNSQKINNITGIKSYLMKASPQPLRTDGGAGHTVAAGDKPHPYTGAYPGLTPTRHAEAQPSPAGPDRELRTAPLTPSSHDTPIQRPLAAGDRSYGNGPPHPGRTRDHPLPTNRNSSPAPPRTLPSSAHLRVAFSTPARKACRIPHEKEEVCSEHMRSGGGGAEFKTRMRKKKLAVVLRMRPPRNSERAWLLRELLREGGSERRKELYSLRMRGVAHCGK
ncbi:putative C-_U-editing enzyme APOBEC-4 [Terrapene carolina triunguis]|uniref:putative C->U-editing enzyme APOBEC-4 n=1 Tax=Terrapene triunguis TaxID=2587831 RepID=UPI00115612D5|nr:putative C->U-editing enzyme APOBEC-4 [Terrapene carolina triunguis]